MPDPANTPPPMEFPRNLSYKHFLSLTPAPPPGPRPGQTCLYRSEEVFYADPTVIDRLESKVWSDYYNPRAPESSYNQRLVEMAAASIRWQSYFNSNACQ